jgi:hypothetical protein
MTWHLYKILDQDFDSNNAASYRLLVEWDGNVLSWAVYYPFKNKFIGIGQEKMNEAESFHSLKTKHDILNLEFKDVKFSIWSPYSAQIPNAYFEERNTKKYVQDIHFTPKNLTFKSNIGRNGVYVNTYGIEDSIAPAIKQDFPEAKIFHLSQTIIDGGVHQSLHAGSAEKMLIMNVKQKKVLFYVGNQKQFELYNHFEVNDMNDVVYFCMMMYQGLGLNIEKSPLWVYNNAFDEADLLKKLQNHFPLASNGKPLFHIDFSSSFDAAQINGLMSLFSLQLCE